MDSGEWRYGQADDPPPNGAPAPNLWSEDPSGGWDAADRWPAPRSAPPASGPPSGPPSGPDGLDDTGWQRAAEWGQGRYPAVNPPAPALPQYPGPEINPGGTFGKAGTLPAHGYPPSGSHGAEVGPVSPAGGLPPYRAGHVAPPRRRAASPVRRRGRRPANRRRSRRGPFGEEPAYGPVLGYTAAWYGIPALLYLVWLVTLDDQRQGLVGRQFVASLPWLLAAVVLSLAVAGMLRWAIVGWRAVTLSFAAAVIGAGVTTIAHSLTL